jgi:hypothetical protein
MTTQHRDPLFTSPRTENPMTQHDDKPLRSFRLQRPHGNDDVTHEALLWLLVLVIIVAPLLWVVYSILG